MRISLNVNRTRITVLGFTLTMILFAMGLLIAVEGLQPEEAVWKHLPSFVAFFVGLVAAMVSMWMFVGAQCVQAEGDSDLRMFALGEAVMYIALSQTLAGIIKNFLGGFRRTFDKLPSFENVNPERLPEVQPSAELLMGCLYWMGGLGWFVIIYVGPVFAVFRAPLSRRQRVMLLCFYAALVLLVFWIQALGYHVWLADADMRYSMLELFLWQWWQPHLWGL